MLNEKELGIEIKDEGQLKALAGIGEKELVELGKLMEEMEEEAKRKKYQEMVEAGLRVRKIGGGRKGILRTGIQKALFMMVYLKTYPTYDDLGSRFKMTGTGAYRNIERLWPLFQKVLQRLGMMPGRQFAHAGEFREELGMPEIVIDVTARPQDKVKQEDE